MGKTILITGASSGLGQSIARYLSQAGHKVYGTSRKPPTTASGFTILQADVTEAESLDRAVAQIIRETGHLDVLINNAGLGIASPVETASISDVQRVLDTNVTGVVRAIQTVLPHMRTQGEGLIINISSIGSEIGLPYRGIYSASKAAVDRITEALRTELAPFGIQACSIQPGGVRTEINKHRLMEELPSTSVYKQSFEHTCKIINESVDEGLEPAIFGRLIQSVLQEKKVKPVYRVGKSKEKLSVHLKRLLPSSIFENLVKKHYGLK